MAVPRMKYPNGIARDYSKKLAALADEYARLAIDLWSDKVRQDAALSDADPGEVSQYLAALEAALAGVVVEWELRQIAEQFMTAIRQTAFAQVNAQVTKVLGFNPLIRDPVMEQIMQAAVAQNVKLIKSISTQMLDKIEQTVWSMVRQGEGIKAIAAEIEHIGGVTRNRAILIAVDQTGKFFGEMTKARHTTLGLKTYIWRTAKDERVRGNPSGLYPHSKPSHWDREGQVYTWEKGADGEHPGQAVRCRCTAEINEDELKEIWEPSSVSV